jgi:hypothetical protein
MSNITTYAQDLLGRALCGRAPAMPTQVYLGLGTGGADATGVVGEPSGSGYARQRVTFSGTGAQQNSNTVTFTFTGAVGTLAYAGMFDAATGGNALTWSALAQSVSVTGAGTVTINPAGLSLTPT